MPRPPPRRPAQGPAPARTQGRTADVRVVYHVEQLPRLRPKRPAPRAPAPPSSAQPPPQPRGGGPSRHGPAARRRVGISAPQPNVRRICRTGPARPVHLSHRPGPPGPRSASLPAGRTVSCRRTSPRVWLYILVILVCIFWFWLYRHRILPSDQPESMARPSREKATHRQSRFGICRPPTRPRPRPPLRPGIGPSQIRAPAPGPPRIPSPRSGPPAAHAPARPAPCARRGADAQGEQDSDPAPRLGAPSTG